MTKLLSVDPDPQAQRVLRMILPRHYSLVTHETGSGVLDVIAAERPDIVLLDLDLRDAEGLRVLQDILSQPYAPPVIVVSALRSTRVIVDAVRTGAFDYVMKPFTLTVLEESMLRALTARLPRTDLAAEPELAAETAVAEDVTGGVLGRSKAAENLREFIRKFAQADEAVLLLGESGTGKDLAARALHRLSRGVSGRFVAVNCGAVPDTLFESEMFGAERGAFTGAVSRPGSFERASEGTLFLDEIGELSLLAQVKLLRALEEREVRRIGGTRPIRVAPRIVAASNRPLRKLVDEGRFRSDLYYRINVLPHEVPPLRQRREDIPILAEHFLNHGVDEPRQLTPAAINRLMEHSWPGNVRELRNTVIRAGLICDDHAVMPRHITFV